MFDRLPDALKVPTDRIGDDATAPTDGDMRPLPTTTRGKPPIGHPDLSDAEVRRCSWRRRPNVRTTAFRHRRRSVKLRP